MYCSKCGTEIKNGVKFCTRCGAPLGGRQIESFTQAIKLAQSGNEAGFAYLYEETYKSKFYLAIKYMENRESAEDVLQDAYIKAFSKLDTLKDPETFPAWLGTIVANTAKNALQKNNPILFSDLSDETDEGEEFNLQIEDESVDVQPEESYLQQESTELLAEMMSSLSEEQRMCILMFHIEGESIRDIAEALDCSENTVKSRLNYGRKNLRAKAEDLKKKGYTIAGSASLPLLLSLLSNDAYAMSSEPTFLVAGQQMKFAILRQIPSLVKSTTAAHVGVGAAAKTGEGTAAKTGAAAAVKTGTATAAKTGAATAAKAGAATAVKVGLMQTVAGKALVGVIVAGVAAASIGGGVSVHHNNQVRAQKSAIETVAAENETETAGEVAAAGTESEGVAQEAATAESETEAASQEAATIGTESETTAAEAATAGTGTEAASEAATEETGNNVVAASGSGANVSDSVRGLYEQVLRDIQDGVYTFSHNVLDPEKDYGYFLIDMDNDGIQEMIACAIYWKPLFSLRTLCRVFSAEETGSGYALKVIDGEINTIWPSKVRDGDEGFYAVTNLSLITNEAEAHLYTIQSDSLVEGEAEVFDGENENPYPQAKTYYLSDFSGLDGLD